MNESLISVSIHRAFIILVTSKQTALNETNIRARFTRKQIQHFETNLNNNSLQMLLTEFTFSTVSDRKHSSNKQTWRKYHWFIPTLHYNNDKFVEAL